MAVLQKSCGGARAEWPGHGCRKNSWFMTRISRVDMTDPVTGEVKKVQLDSTRRLKVIYDTNLRTVHSEG